MVSVFQDLKRLRLYFSGFNYKTLFDIWIPYIKFVVHFKILKYAN